MKKLVLLSIVTILVSCKTTSTSCDAYSYAKPGLDENVEFDIYKISNESQHKYVMSTIIK